MRAAKPSPSKECGLPCPQNCLHTCVRICTRVLVHNVCVCARNYPGSGRAKPLCQSSARVLSAPCCYTHTLWFCVRLSLFIQNYSKICILLLCVHNQCMLLFTVIGIFAAVHVRARARPPEPVRFPWCFSPPRCDRAHVCWRVAGKTRTRFAYITLPIDACGVYMYVMSSSCCSFISRC